MKKAFTLAEVLITLGIIGIVAALTLPTLIAKQQEKATVTALKKFYSTISQAYMMATEEYGAPSNWASNPLDTNLAAKDYLDKLAPYLKLTKNCGITTNQNCFSYNQDTTLSGVHENIINTNPNYSKAKLADGEFIYLRIDLPGCLNTIAHGMKYCGYISVDINGAKKPNVIGIDNFRFYITDKGILPYGVKEDTMYSFKDTCNTKKNGYGCTAWVLFNENLNYKYCDDLDWDLKTKCK